MTIKDALVQYNKAMGQLETAEKAVQESLKNIRETAKTSTIDVDGQFFQVRERREKLYLCELSGKPRGRPLGSKNSRTVSKEVIDAPVEESIDIQGTHDLASA